MPNKTERRAQRGAVESAPSTEVIVKVAGGAKGRAAIHAHLASITRDGSLLAELDGNGLLLGAQEVNNLAEVWWMNALGGRRRDSRDTANLILSPPRGTERKSLVRAARNFARKYFDGRFSYVLAVPEETSGHPFAYLTLLRRGHAGKRLQIDKTVLRAWRADFAAALQARGVRATASSWWERKGADHVGQ